MIIFKRFFFIFLFSLFSNYALSENIKVDEIKIIGNKTISKETILEVAGIGNKNFVYTTENLNLAQKKLFETNFFSNINIELVNNILNIIVVENPLVDFITIEGLDNHDNHKTNIEKIVSLKSNQVFSESALNKDILSIKNYLSNIGYFNSKITYLVKKTSNERVNVFIEIQLNHQFLIKNIFFIGDKKFSSSKLIDVITSKQSGWFSFLNSNAVPSFDRVNYDLSLLKNFYLSEGYYDVQIANSSIDLVDDKYVNVIFSINSGNRYTITDYVIKNDLSLFLQTSQVTDINNIIKKYLKDFYNYKKVINLKNDLNDYYKKLNIYVDIQNTFEKKNENELLLNIEMNQNSVKKIINDILIIGNDITEEKVIRNNLTFSEGDIFYQQEIDKSKDSIQATKIFKNVDITSIDYNDGKKINVKVIEQPTGEISSGLGIGSSGSSISFNLKENNFLGQGIYTNVGLNFGTQQVLGSITVNNPDYANTGNNLKSSLFLLKNNYNNAGYDNKIIGSNISTTSEIFKDIYFENGFGLSYDQISITQAASPLISTQAGNYFTTKYFYDVTTDKRNRKFKPTSGYVVSFGQDVSIPPSDIPSLSNTIYGSLHASISEEFIGSIKYKLKSINSFNNDAVKLSDRVFVSDSELRGFSNRGIGPKVNGDFVGGNYIFTSTAATTFPNGIPDSWNAITNVFFDVANVWGSDLRGVSESNKIRSSLGIGFTWISPIGPVSLSYAEPITKANTDDVQKFNFNIGSAF